MGNNNLRKAVKAQQNFSNGCGCENISNTCLYIFSIFIIIIILLKMSIKNFNAFLSYAQYINYSWGDAGIAHISEDCHLVWDCC